MLALTPWSCIRIVDPDESSHSTRHAQPGEVAGGSRSTTRCSPAVSEPVCGRHSLSSTSANALIVPLPPGSFAVGFSPLAEPPRRRCLVALIRNRDHFAPVVLGSASRYGSLLVSISQAIVASFRAPATTATLRFFFWAKRRKKWPNGPGCLSRCCAASINIGLALIPT